MTDVQVSYARRIGFTALAVVVFGSTVLAAHHLGDDCWENARRSATLFGDHVVLIPLASGVLCLTLLPTLFVFLSARHSLAGLRDPHVLVCAALFAGTISFSYWIGRHNVTVPWEEMWARQNAWGPEPPDFDARLAAIRAEVQISPFWLLLPIILTTAFVIFGAMRRAVRDAEVEAGGEGE